MGTDAGGRSLITALAVASILALAGCSGSGKVDLSGHGKTRGYYKVGAPYQVKGVWYHPRVDYDYDETGTASWYGEAFQGRPTANGEIFELNQVSAAHKTLQLPSIVEVTNLQNGRALRMRVNDRGPFADDRIIDVSRRAAQMLGFERAGTAPVRVRIIKEESIKVAEAAMRGDIGQSVFAQSRPVTQTRLAAARPSSVARIAPAATTEAVETVEIGALAARSAPPAAAPPEPRPIIAPPPPEPAHYAARRGGRSWPGLIGSAHAAPAPAATPARQWTAEPARLPGRIFVQAGAFAVAENATRARARIASLGNAEVSRMTVNGVALYRVRLGPVESDNDARRLLKRLVDSGYPDARVTGDR